MSLQVEFPFNNANSYIYDNTKITITGGKAELLITETFPNATMGANYNTDADANWGDGDLNGTMLGSSAVTGGDLRMTGYSMKYCEYVGTNKLNPRTGCIRQNFRTAFSGDPTSVIGVIAFRETATIYDNGMVLH